jgi:hypothetical protein
VCISEICPAGPPKLMNPSLSQYSRAARKPGGAGRVVSDLVLTIANLMWAARAALNLPIRPVPVYPRSDS